MEKKIFVEYIVRNSEQEGHFKYFVDRARLHGLWTVLKEDNDTLQSLVCILLTVRQNGPLIIINAMILGFAKEPDMYAVLQTLGKHAFDYPMIKLWKVATAQQAP